jgi:hypothetical protein
MQLLLFIQHNLPYYPWNERRRRNVWCGEDVEVVRRKEQGDGGDDDDEAKFYGCTSCV